jgi:MraZ protein
MVDLVGSASCKLDDKFRLTLPSKFLKQIGEEPEMDKFIVKPALHMPCIEIYPKTNWDVTMGWLKKLDRLRPEVQTYLLYFLRDHQFIHLDKSNRLLLPGELIEHAGIGKAVMLTSALHVLQVWDYDTYKAKTSEPPANFQEITDKALDKKNE